ncbi:PaaX family transcriptional regulator C-terminal domain-containing protein [Geodermatophilus sp. SYSU D00814]
MVRSPETPGPVRGRWTGGTPSMSASPLQREHGAPGQPRLLIMDVCGAFMRPLGGWLPVARLVGLMAVVGVEEPATRSAVSRMRQRDLLVPETRGGQRGYRLSERALAALDEADRRIYSRVPSSTVAEGWVLVSYSVPERERDKRHVLRSRLEWLGFGMLGSGLWLAPRWIQPELEAAVEALGFEEYVTVFEAHHLGFEDLPALVGRCWHLEQLRDLYAEFLDTAGTTAERWRSHPGDDRDAFVDHVSTLHQWRKFPYLDPGLPAELLPPEWEGKRAADLFFELRDRLEEPARRFVADFVSG